MGDVFAAQTGFGAFRECLTELHPPLVVGVDVIEHGEHAGLVFIKRDQRAEALRGQRVENQGGARAVAGAGARVAFGGGKGLQVAFVAPAHQGFGLGEAVAVEDTRRGFFASRRRFHGDEIKWNTPLSLVQELEEGVLGFAAGSAPDNQAARFFERFAVSVGAFAEAFHVELLKVLREGGEAVRVQDHRAVVDRKVMVVPAIEEGELHRQIVHQLCSLKVIVHRVRARKQGGVAVVAVLQDERKGNRRPQREATADPVPEGEHALFVDSEGSRFVAVRRQGDHLSIRGLAAARAQPVAQKAGVGERFFGGEAFRGDDQQGGLRIERALDCGDLEGIGGGEKVDFRAVGEVFESFAEQPRPEFGTADAEVDDIACFCCWAAQGVMQGGPSFACVDVIAADDRLDPRAHVVNLQPFAPQCFRPPVDVVF